MPPGALWLPQQTPAGQTEIHITRCDICCATNTRSVHMSAHTASALQVLLVCTNMPQVSPADELSRGHFLWAQACIGCPIACLNETQHFPVNLTVLRPAASEAPQQCTAHPRHLTRCLPFGPHDCSLAPEPAAPASASASVKTAQSQTNPRHSLFCHPLVLACCPAC